MSFNTKLKQMVIITAILIGCYYIAGAFSNDTFNTSEWSRKSKFYMIYGSIITIGWVCIYSIDNSKNNKDGKI